MILSKAKSEMLLAKIRNGELMSGNDKLNLIFQLSLPSILAQMTNVMMFFIDQSMVGRLGAQAAASIGLVESTTWLFGGLASAVSMGFSVQVAHFIGANDFEKARQVVRHGIITAFCVSFIIMLTAAIISQHLPYWLGGGADIAPDASRYFLIFSLAAPFFQMNNMASSMLKCEGNMRVPSILSVTVCALDVIFNFFFIFPTRTVSLLGADILIPGAGLGVTGAAIGTGLAYVCVSMIQSWMAFFRSKILSIRLDKARFVFVGNYLKNAFNIGAPMALQMFLMSSAQIISTAIVAPLGNFAIAANTFAITAESLCYMPGYGIGDAATTLVGQSIGAGRKDLCRSFAHMAVWLGMIIMAVMGVVMYFCAYDMMALMTPVEEICRLGADSLRIEAFAEPMFAASIVAYSVFVGAGDTLRPALINLSCMWFVRLTLAAILAKDYGLPGVWTAMAVELSFRGMLFLIRLYRGKWIKNID
ncbi:MAG: MATE family efflux transporter [Prevotella sp.]|nr:MATE family efflux transporter [Prevotella sp.]MDY6409269.1 MATE family efflux transporter [Prevotella sp.]